MLAHCADWPPQKCAQSTGDFGRVQRQHRTLDFAFGSFEEYEHLANRASP
jgi:hypothetical protein